MSASQMFSAVSVASGVQIAARVNVFWSSRTFPGQGALEADFLPRQQASFPRNRLLSAFAVHEARR